VSSKAVSVIPFKEVTNKSGLVPKIEIKNNYNMSFRTEQNKPWDLPRQFSNPREIGAKSTEKKRDSPAKRKSDAKVKQFNIKAVESIDLPVITRIQPKLL
jgi:hypothetical protein